MADVPSNLIPTRITQLPLAPVADENSLMMIVYQGNNYQIRVGDLLSVAGVPTTRQVIAGTGMTGGGQLSSNVTLSIAPGGVGSTELANSGVTPGSYGTATDIPVFTVDATGRVMAATTVPATISGYVPESRQVIAGTGLTGGGALTSNVTLTANLSDATPQLGNNTGSAGVSTEMSRADHVHPAVDLSDQTQINGILPLDQGGTARSLTPNPGAIVWSGADGLYVGPQGLAGQVLVSSGTGAPTWGSAIFVSDQAANLVYAGPAAGPAGPTAFRALVNNDLPGTISSKSINSATITGSSINSTPIGAASAAAVTGTTVTANTQFSGPGTGITGTASGLSIGGNAATATSATTATTAATATTANNVSSGAANQIVFNTGSGATSFITAPISSSTFLRWNGTAFDWSTVGTGTVTSVAVSGGTTGLTVSGSPITSSGTITLGGTVAIAHGGTNGTATPTAGAIAYGTGTAYAFSSAGSASQVLLSGGTGVPTWSVQSSLAVGTATNLAGGTASQIPYQTGAGATAFIANGTSGQVLRSNGASAPSWAAIDGGSF